VVGYLFIFTLGWGIEGAAWAVVLCQGAVAAVFIAILRSRMGVGSWRPDPATMRSLVRVGGELALRTGSLLAGLTIATALAARIGTESIAAWQIAMQVWLLLSLTLDAVAIAAQTLVASRLGVADQERARAIGGRLLALGAYVGIALALILGLAAPFLAQLFTDSERVASLATGLLIWIGFLQPIGAIAFTLDGILIGASDTGFLALAMVGVTAVFVVVMLLLYGAGVGLWGLASAMTIWLSLRAATTLWRFRGAAWARPRSA
jgi:putative MATE family efflux protein